MKRHGMDTEEKYVSDAGEHKIDSLTGMAADWRVMRGTERDSVCEGVCR